MNSPGESDDPSGNPLAGAWPSLRGALVFLGVSAIACAAMTLGAWEFLDDAKARYEIQKERLDKARGRRRQREADRAMVHAYLPRFQRLVQAGFIGEERRLTWLEALDNAAERLKLPELRYDLSARAPHHPPDLPPHIGPYRIHASDMRLTLGLLHEGDLFSVLTELDRHALGLYSVVDCRLRRVGREAGRDPAKANLNADCRLRWYSLKG